MDKQKDNVAVTRMIAEEIAKFRREFWDSLCTALDEEIDEMESSGFDPARGQGRGPKWAEGA